MRRPFAWIETAGLKRCLDASERLAIIDVRGPAEFAGPLGHIAGARNIPVDRPADRLGEPAGLEQPTLVLVCRTDKRSAAAARILHGAGFAQINVLRRGMEQWNADGLPVEERSAGA